MAPYSLLVLMRTSVVGCHLAWRLRTNHPRNRSKDAAANFSRTGGVGWTWSWRSSTMPSA